MSPVIKSVICVVCAVFFVIINTIILFLKPEFVFAKNDDNNYNVFYQKWIGTVVFMATITIALFCIYFSISLKLIISYSLLTIECLLLVIYALCKYKCVTVNGDDIKEEISDFSVVTNKQPTKKQLEDALFGLKVVKHVKSNAIVLVKDGQTIGVGAGQMNRVGACKIACVQANEKAKDSVLASDAFFPMSDTVELAHEYGISCIIQPGGSIKDKDSIDKCNELNIAMIFTGKRHFKH